MQYSKKTKKLMVWLLAMAVIVTALPQMPLVANAAEMNEAQMNTEAADGAQQVSEVTAVPESEGSVPDSSGENETQDTTADSTTEKESENAEPDNSEEGEEKEATPEPSGADQEENGESEETQEGNSEEKTTEEEEITVEDSEIDGISENDLEEVTVYAETSEDTDYGTPVHSGVGAAGSTIEWAIYENGKLVVTGEGEISEGRIYNRAPWYNYRNSITTAEIKVSGMKDASRMFYECYELSKLDVSGWDMSSVTNMSHMFYGCRRLTALEWGGCDISSVTDMSHMFYECHDLSKLDASGWDMSSVTNMSHMFSSSGLSELDASGWKIGSVTDMSYMFYGCWRLTALEWGGCDISSVTDMSYMFYGCYELSKLDASGWDMSSVTNMSYMFSSSGLSELDASGWNTGSVTDMSGMFSECYHLSELDASGWNTGSVTNMGGMFSECYHLSELDVSGWNTDSVTNMGGMFSECYELSELDLSSWDVGNVDYFYDMFEDTELEEINAPYNMKDAIMLPRVTDGTHWRLPDGTEITEIPAGNAESITVTRRIMIISFSGENFVLKDSAGQTIANKQFPVRKGTNDAIAFALEPVELPEGCTLKLSEDLSNSIRIRTSAEQYHYIISPEDAEEGYVRDVEIPVETDTAKNSKITFDYYAYAIESFVVSNGAYLSDENQDSVEVSNAYTTVVYVKPVESDEIIRPTFEIGYHYSGSRIIPYLTDPSVMSEKEKEMVKKGYYIFDMGVVTQDEEVRIEYKTMSRVHFITEGFPDDVRIQVYPANGESDRITLSKDTDTVLTEKNGTFSIMVDFNPSEYPDYRWCMPMISFDRAVTIDGDRQGTSWKVKNSIEDLVTIKISLEPSLIPLSYVESEVLDLRVEGSHVSLSEDKKSLKAYGGDDFSLSFGLADGISLTGTYFVTYWGESVKLEYVETDGRYTVDYAFENSYALYTDIEIVLSTKDSLGRYSLSGLNSKCTISVNKPKNGYMYNGKAIEPEVRSVTFSRTTSSGKQIKETLSKNDYTVSYSDNVNVGTATVTVTAAEGSEKYKGSSSTTFEISKANEPAVYGLDETGSCRIPIDAEKAGTVQQADLSKLFEINSAYEKNIAPLWYGVKSCDLGDTLTETPTIQGHMMTYSVMSSITKDSRPAKVTLFAYFANYENVTLKLVLQPVKREELVLGGTVTARNQVYDGMPIAFEAFDLYVVSVAGEEPDDADAVMEQIWDDLTFHYTGTGDTKYDSLMPPVDVGTYQVSVAVSTENIDYRSEYFEAGTFTISERAATITAKDTKLYRDDLAPIQFDYEVLGDGLAKGDAISVEPILACPTLNMAQNGEYPLNIDVAGVHICNEDGRDVTANYIISGVNGMLRVQEPEPGSYTVIFDLVGKGDRFKQSGMEAGSLITKPRDPSAEGYVFLGWYSDETFAKLWDFDTDIIQGDLVLYAGWSKSLTENDGMTLYVRDILPQTYTGKAIQPVISVYAADGRTILKKNKDYSIAYKNNIDADTKKFKDRDVIPEGGIGTSLTDTSQGFDSGLAYVVITGKGNYTGTVYINFHINPADFSTAGSAGSDFTLKYTEQFEEKIGKTAAVVNNLKSKKATLKYGKDYTLTVTNTADNAQVTLTSKGQLPLNAGTYKLTIDGIDNYTGSISKDLYVASKTQLLKNAKVTCTGTISDVTKEQLEAGIEPQNLQVSMNKTPLTKDEEYEVECINNHAVGTATVTVRGIGGSYFGSKSITFKIKGKTFKVKEFEAISLEDMTYNGTALTQNDVRLKIPGGSELAYGIDYTVSYKNNIKKGKATMTFTANPKSGYSGSFKKTFKITAAGLDSDTVVVNGAAKQDDKWILSGSVPYQKGGATPADKFVLRLSSNGTALTMGKDYTIKYKNNTEVSNGKAYMTLNGKGNFSGTMTVFFDIEKASLSDLYKEKRVTVTSKAVKATFSYDREGELKNPEYEFKPAVTVKDGKKALKQGVDYKIDYYGNARELLEYGGQPYVKITGIGNYSGTLAKGDESFNVPLSIYQYSISNSKIYIVYEEDDFTYTGGQIIPKISAVYYGNASDISKAKKNGETDEAILTTEKPEQEPGKPKPKYEYGLTELSEYKEGYGGDYIISAYGANTVKGKTGKVTIKGVYDYSGSATGTFTINPKAIYSLIQGSSE